MSSEAAAAHAIAQAQVSAQQTARKEVADAVEEAKLAVERELAETQQQLLRATEMVAKAQAEASDRIREHELAVAQATASRTEPLRDSEADTRRDSQAEPQPEPEPEPQLDKPTSPSSLLRAHKQKNLLAVLPPADTPETTRSSDDDEPPPPSPQPARQFQVMKRSLLRESSDRSSPSCGTLEQGEIVTALEESKDGTRVRFEGGWASIKSSKGNVLLTEWKEAEEADAAEMEKEEAQDSDTVKVQPRTAARRQATQPRDSTAKSLPGHADTVTFAVKQGSKKLELAVGSRSLKILKVSLSC